MKRLAATLCVAGLGLVGTASKASAASVIYSATTTGLTNMTHQNAYTWQLEGFNISGYTITSAVLTFTNFYNYTSAASDPYNIMWVDLLDTSTHTGNGTIASLTDDTNSGTLGASDVLDGFRFGPQGTNVSVVGTNGLVKSNTSQTYFGSSANPKDGPGAGNANVQGYNVAPGTLGNNGGAFGTTPVTWSITVTNSTVLTALANYIANGNNIALGLDSDCHFGDDSIQFQIYGQQNNVTQSAVPEPGTMLLVGSGLFAAYRRRRKRSA